MTFPGETRPEWIDYPELIITDDPAIPAHVEDWLQRRYAHPSTVNHDHWRAEHVAAMATEIAPGPRLPLRRRIDWAGVAALLAIVAVLVALALLLNRPIVTGY